MTQQLRNVREEAESALQQLLVDMALLSSHAQKARSELILERVDNMVDHLLELERASRSARNQISILQRIGRG